MSFETYANMASTSPALFGILPYYGMIALVGGLCVAGWAYLEWNKKGYRTWDFLFLASWVFLFAIYGAKIWYMIFDPVNAFGNVNDILDVLIIVFIPAFGRSIMGTIVFVPIGIWMWQRVWGSEYRTLDLMDIILPAFFIGQAIGRWGNFVNHEVYGHVVSGDSLNWLPSFIKDGMYIQEGKGMVAEYRSPLFLYESFADAIGFIILILIFKTNKYWKEGTLGLGYMTLYGLFRGCFELLRDKDFIMHWGPIPTSFVCAWIMFGICLGLLIFVQWIRKKDI